MCCGCVVLPQCVLGVSTPFHSSDPNSRNGIAPSGGYVNNENMCVCVCVCACVCVCVWVLVRVCTTTPQTAVSPLAAVSHLAFVSEHGAVRVHLQLRTPHHIPQQFLHTLTIDVDTSDWLSVCLCCTLHLHSDSTKSNCCTSGESHRHEARSGNRGFESIRQGLQLWLWGEDV